MRKGVLSRVAGLTGGLLTGFADVFGDRARRGAAELARVYDMPRLVIRGHESFVRTTGWPMNRFHWEMIRLKAQAAAIYVERDAPLRGSDAVSQWAAKTFRAIQVQGLPVPARHAAGLHEFRVATGTFGSPRPNAADWTEMWKRVGERSLLIVLEESQLNHGEMPQH